MTCDVLLARPVDDLDPQVKPFGARPACLSLTDHLNRSKLMVYALTQWGIEVTDPDSDDTTLFGVFHSESHAEENIAKAREWGVTAKMEAVPIERFGVQALRDCGWLEE